MKHSRNHLKSSSFDSAKMSKPQEHSPIIKIHHEKSSASDYPTDHDVSKKKINFSLKSYLTSESIKDLISQTSEKLKTFGSKSRNSNYNSENQEILNLKEKISILEEEK